MAPLTPLPRDGRWRVDRRGTLAPVHPCGRPKWGVLPDYAYRGAGEGVGGLAVLLNMPRSTVQKMRGVARRKSHAYCGWGCWALQPHATDLSLAMHPPNVKMVHVILAGVQWDSLFLTTWKARGLST